MNLVTVNHSFQYELEKLLRVFFPAAKIAVTTEPNGEPDVALTVLERTAGGANVTATLCVFGKTRTETAFVSDTETQFGDTDDSLFERKLALTLFSLLCDATGYTPPWGILTGVRPAKLMNHLVHGWGEAAGTAYFRNELRVSEEKTALALAVARQEAPIMATGDPRSFSLYVSIPFCPSRCSYCSFVSHSNEHAKKLMPDYVRLLCGELRETARIAAQLDLKLESVYIGGGTPTALSAEQLRTVTDAIGTHFALTPGVEYTIEAGRPDSVTDEKLDVIRNCGATRISINPQTFNDSVLEAIGRRHTGAQTETAMHMARSHGFDNINMDLIAGLPTDTFDSFCATLETTLSFRPENVTVHTLSRKRAATMVTEKLESGDAEAANAMLDHAKRVLTAAGYVPYYMYRQSNCLGNLENVGWARPGFACRYNVYMMEETHTVLAVGAGAVTKLCAPAENQIERIFNFKYPYEYISRFDELLARKQRIPAFYDEVFATKGGE
ncbi:MAG: coproporphyrinogen dehydrogenase HemZ [Clostridia bacterium]|nr:coproporphyrinogen dehydrogenase HemZ [Clostridia bacterium]